MNCIFERNTGTYIDSPYIKENTFTVMHTEELPKYEEIKERLPVPVWAGHEKEIECYYKTWEIAFGNISNPIAESGFVSPFIDTAFNGNLFMWDSSFILMFCKYAAHIFNFQQTLDNMYARQHKDGFISREICEKDGREMFMRFDPSSTGPNIMPWCEWEYFKIFKDSERIRKVFPCLLAYHKWLKDNHTWRDGSYWSSGLGCGMDNMESRVPKGVHQCLSNAHMIWADVNFQQIISGGVLLEMAKLLGREDEETVAEIACEHEYLKKMVNEKLWDDKTSYYYDLWQNDEFNYVKSIGAYWSLLAEVVPKDKIDKFVAHLENEKEFNRPHRVPTVSADDPHYNEYGGYWNGAVWAPTNYMVLKGLEKNGYYKLAYDIGLNHLENVTKVFEKTGTVWENYSPEHTREGNPAKADFVGWTGLVPIAVLFEYVLGIRGDAPNGRIFWNINRTERHGILKYPLGKENTVDLICPERKSEEEEPFVEIRSDKPVTVEICWNGEHKTIRK